MRLNAAAEIGPNERIHVCIGLRDNDLCYNLPIPFVFFLIVVKIY